MINVKVIRTVLFLTVIIKKRPALCTFLPIFKTCHLKWYIRREGKKKKSNTKLQWRKIKIWTLTGHWTEPLAKMRPDYQWMCAQIFLKSLLVDNCKVKTTVGECAFFIGRMLVFADVETKCSRSFKNKAQIMEHLAMMGGHFKVI